MVCLLEAQRLPSQLSLSGFKVFYKLTFVFLQSFVCLFLGVRSRVGKGWVGTFVLSVELLNQSCKK